jgi:hypothetical protein
MWIKEGLDTGLQGLADVDKRGTRYWITGLTDVEKGTRYWIMIEEVLGVGLG